MKIVARIHSATDISEIFNQLIDDGYDAVLPTKNTIYAYFDERKKENLRSTLIATRTNLRWDYGSSSESFS